MIRAILPVYCSMFSFENLKEQLLKLLRLDALVDSLSAYIEARVNLIKHEIKEEVTMHLSRVMVWLVILFLALIALGFLSLTAALMLNVATESSYNGFLIVSGIYVLAGLIMYSFRGTIAVFIQRKIKDK